MEDIYEMEKISAGVDISNNSKRIIYYYQTLTDLSPILFEGTPVTHIFLSAFHFGNNPDGSPYIHLNNHNPFDEKFDKVWQQLSIAKHNYNIEIHIMLGGAGGAFVDLFSNFGTYYPMLIETIMKSKIVNGINLDIEEEVNLSDVKMLIDLFKRDIAYDFVISMAPVQGSLQGNGPGMGGFSYKDLRDSAEGKLIDFYCGQFYFDLGGDCYDDCVQNGYPANQVVLGMIQDQPIDTAQKVVSYCAKKYPDFGGVFMWEYFDAPPDGTKNPGSWCKLMKGLMDGTLRENENENKKTEKENEKTENGKTENEKIGWISWLLSWVPFY